MKINSMSISGLFTLNMHALNNEGTEGNYLQTRMVEIVDAKGIAYSVNAISGDMFKHIQAEHLNSLAKEDGVLLCDGCSINNPNRINVDNGFISGFADGVKDAAILDKVLERCAGDDAEGILITQEIGKKKRAIGRKSIVEFGWAIGEPEKTKTESYFHVKFDQTERASGRGDDKTGANIGQNIFHRPASSGRYAIVLNTDICRIGFNDITRTYPIDPEERKKRAMVVLKSILATFLKPEGAHRNTQNPHVVNFQGCITASSTMLPAPAVSALNENYLKEIENICTTLNELSPNSITKWEFNSLQEFVATIKEIITSLEI